MTETMEDKRTRVMYGGRITLTFDPGKHQYRVNGSPVDGVTTVLNVMGKGGLTQWAANQAVAYVKSKLKPGKSLDEVQIEELCREAAKAHTRARDKAADIGTLVHAWVEQFVYGAKKRDDVPQNAQIKKGVQAFLEWIDGNHVEFLEAEMMVYSEKHGFAGTLDFVANVNGRRLLGDLKTSSGIYSSHAYQTAAYLLAVNEQHVVDGTIGPIDGRIIVNCRKDATLETRIFDDNEGDARAFLAALTLHRQEKKWKR